MAVDYQALERALESFIEQTPVFNEYGPTVTADGDSMATRVVNALLALRALRELRLLEHK